MWNIFKKTKTVLKPYYIEYDYILNGKSTIVLAVDYNNAVIQFKKEFKNNYYKIHKIEEI